MASVQTDDIIGALGQMRDLNGRTNDLLRIIQRQQQANTGAISQMRSAATLIRTLMQGRQDMQAIMAAVRGHGVDMNASVERIIEALNGQPTVEEMEAVIQALEAAQNQAQASIPAAAAAPTPGPGPAPGPGMVGPPSRPTGMAGPPSRPTSGGYRRSSDMKSNTRKHKGGYNWRSWRSTEKKTKTRTKKRNKKRLSSKRSSNKVS
jgi:TolA-binding protein